MRIRLKYIHPKRLKCCGHNEKFIKNCKNEPKLKLVMVIHDDRIEEGYCEQHRQQAQELLERFVVDHHRFIFIKELSTK